MKHSLFAQHYRPKSPGTPTLRLTPYALAKIIYLRDLGRTEVGGFGVGSLKDPLLIRDFELPAQRCTETSVVFGPEAIACYFDRQVDAGRKPAQFARVLFHTRPCGWPNPSSTDLATMAGVFGHCDWSILFIVSRDNRMGASIQFAAGPRASLPIPIRLNCAVQFAGSNPSRWEAEYRHAVTIVDPRARVRAPTIATVRELHDLEDDYLFAWRTPWGANGAPD